MTFNEITERMKEISANYIIGEKSGERLAESMKYVLRDTTIENWLVVFALNVLVNNPRERMYIAGLKDGISTVLELVRLQMEEKEIKELEKMVK